jgi:hypothetical protein
MPEPPHHKAGMTSGRVRRAARVKAQPWEQRAQGPILRQDQAAGARMVCPPVGRTAAPAGG